MKKHPIALMIAWLALPAAWAAATVHTVTPETIVQTMEKLQPGDTMVLEDGLYPKIRIHDMHGTADAPITIRAANERHAFVRGDGVEPAIWVRGSSHVVIDGLRAENQDNPNQASGTLPQVVNIHGSEHVVLRRCLLSWTNRWANSGVVNVTAGSNNCLIEENELYAFHRNALSAGGGNTRDNVYRRNYLNCRGVSRFGRNWGPVDGIVMYRGAHNIIENNIVEFPDAEGIAYGIWGVGNRLYGNIAINSRSSFAIVQGWTRTAGTADDCTVEHNIAINSRGTGFYTNSVKNALFRNNTSYRSTGNGLTLHNARGHLRHDGFRPSGRVLNHLSIGNGRYGFQIQHLEDFSEALIKGSHGWDNEEGTWGSGTEALQRAEDVDPGIAGAPLWLPPDSPLRGRGVEGADVGASILYRYENGELTDEPLWCPETGAFPHGAVIMGVNDTDHTSLHNIHERLGVTPEALARAYGAR